MEVHWEPRRAAPSMPAQPQIPPVTAPEAAQPGASRPTVMVVEDQPDQALFMRALLQGKYDVVIAADAREAMARIEELGERPAVILMDLSLSGGESGLTLTRRIRRNPRWKHLPIVVATAHAFEEDRERALAAGCNAYLVKPIDAKELLAAVARLTAAPGHLAD